MVLAGGLTVRLKVSETSGDGTPPVLCVAESQRVNAKDNNADSTCQGVQHMHMQ